MSFVDDLLAGGDDYRVTPDMGGAIFAPINGSDDALRRFQPIAERIEANDGLGYNVIHRLTHRSSDLRDTPIDRIAIKVHRSLI